MIVLLIVGVSFVLVGGFAWMLCVAAATGDAQEVVDEEPPMFPEPPMDYKLRGPRR